MCPENQEKQQLESDLYIITRRLKRKMLSLENRKDFQLWKLDLMEAWAAMYLPIADHQSTVNHLIISRLDADVQATLIDLLPEDEGEFKTQKPEALFQHIEDRLGNMNLEELRRLRLDLAKQQLGEGPEVYKDRLHKYYEETRLGDETKFIEKYVCSVYNKVMGGLLRTHKPTLTTIEALEKEIPYYVTQLQIYAKTALDAARAVLAGIGCMRYGLDKGNQKTSMIS